MILDNRGLQPPEPMMRTLKALDELQVGQRLSIINDRRPMFLYEELEERGFSHQTIVRDDGGYQIDITK
ncbi:hypothetical protein BEP19_13815 [Ammoniphilus oxalaticus]|uniref:DUF2249 domain-containing protein n=1 Tax=Ammoniphilus oxalaticus TaxID=66863 RepID=A0A419SEQ9_9BACL|nr:DUF2249 domain-containing protein [Ammoniphilus oxalaticus]RKD21704.1 hypothetical protein BEP19_13815 [Ammoniphilus oxalaticus]